MMDPVMWQSSSTFGIMRQAMTCQPRDGSFAASEVHEKIWLGNVAAARDLRGMRVRNIRGVVNVTEDEPNHFEDLDGRESEGSTAGTSLGHVDGDGGGGGEGGGDARGIRYLSVRVADSEGTDLLGHFERVTAFIDSVLLRREEGEQGVEDGRHGKPAAVLVHCTAGVSRSAAFVAAYLMRKLGVTRDACLNGMRRARPVIRPNDGFMRQLRQWQRDDGHDGRDNKAAAVPAGMEVEDALMVDVEPAMDTSSLRVAPNQVAGHSSKGVGLPSLVDVVAGHFLKPCPKDRKVGRMPFPCHATHNSPPEKHNDGPPTHCVNRGREGLVVSCLLSKNILLSKQKNLAFKTKKSCFQNQKKTLLSYTKMKKK